MNCEECSGLLIDYLEDILSPEESGAVKEHLDGCPECSLELQHYREIRTVAQEEALPAVSAEVLSSLSEAARKNASIKKLQFWKKWSYSPILVPTISAAIALSVWFYYGQTGFEGVDSVTREVGEMKMNTPETRQEAFSDNEEEMNLAIESQEPGEAHMDTVEPDEQKKPAAESRIAPVPPAESEAAKNNPAKGTLRKKDVAEEDMVTYRERTSNQGNSSGIEEPEQETKGQSSDEAVSESRLKAMQPILRDYAGELELAQRQQLEGDCKASIKTNEALLNFTPPPPSDVQAGSYKSLAECYELTGDLPNAVASYKNLSRVDPAQSRFVDEKIEEMKIDAAYMNFEGSDTETESKPAN